VRSGELLERLDRRLLRHCSLEPATAEAELQELGHVCAALPDEVGAGDTAVHDAVLNVLGHVGRAHEQHVDRSIAAGERERTLARFLRPEPRGAEKGDRRLAQSAFRRDGDRQAVVLRRFSRLRASL